MAIEIEGYQFETDPRQNQTGGVFLNRKVDECPVQFISDALYLAKESETKQRPVYRDRILLRYYKQGGAIFDRELKNEEVIREYAERYPRQWAAFNKQERFVEGTPIEAWVHPRMTASLVATLKHLHIFSVEELAKINDETGNKVGPGYIQIRDAARDFLAGENKSAEFLKLQKENDELKERLERLEALAEGKEAVEKKKKK